MDTVRVPAYASADRKEMAREDDGVGMGSALPRSTETRTR
jgi:hypothetical protein